ncbi:MAG: dethiobiotin synthase [Pseudomonadales bacterium]|nr:dethiobiotin synthase [Pseudomonadales bacterium]
MSSGAVNKKPKRIFITGTDTDAGKTVVATQLLRALAFAGYRTAALKPLAAGVDNTLSDPRNSDAVQLQAAATEAQTYEVVNPYLFAEAIAPHIAAKNEDREIDFNECVARCQSLLNSDADVVVVEGAGGWLVPINEQYTMADLAEALDMQVVLVVGMKLGCINHALLTAAAIEQAGLPLVGWVANHLHQDMSESAANVAALAARIQSPLLAELPFSPSIESANFVDQFDLSQLF